MKLEVIKRFLGRDCTFLAFSSEKLKNEDSGQLEQTPCIKVHYKKDRVTIPLYKEFHEVNMQDLEELYNIIVNQEWRQKQN